MAHGLLHYETHKLFCVVQRPASHRDKLGGVKKQGANGAVLYSGTNRSSFKSIR